MMSQKKISAIKSQRYNQSRLSHLKEGKAVLILRTTPCNSRHNIARSPDRFSGTGHGISPAAPTSFVFPILGVLESLLRPLNTSLFYLTSLESVLTLFIATLLDCPPVIIVLDTKFPTLPLAHPCRHPNSSSYVQCIKL